MRYLTLRMAIVAQIILLGSAMSVSGCHSSGGSDGFSGSLSGGQVVPPVTTSNSAMFSAVNVTTEAGTVLRITVTHDVADLTGITVNGPAAAGENAGVLFDVLANQIEARGAVINSPVSADWDISDQELMWLNDGQLYILLSSLTFSSGELRGQINGAMMPPAAEGSFKMGDFYGTVIEGTFSPLKVRGFNLSATKLGGYACLGNNFSIPIRFRAELTQNALNWPFGSFPNSTQMEDSQTGALSWESNIPIPGGFSEFFAMIFTGMIPMQNQFFGVNWLAFDDIAGPEASPLDTGTMNVNIAYRGLSFLDYPLLTLSQLDSQNELPLGLRLEYMFGLGLAPRKLTFTGSSEIVGESETQIAGYYAGTLLVADFGMIGGPYPEGEATRGGNPKPCGMITDGEFVCPDFQLPTPNAGGWFIVAMMVDAPVPLADPVNSYQYGFVFDGDNDPLNNFVNTNPDFENDFFQGTDLWYTVNYTPGSGWSLSAVDASGAGNPQAFFTDAGAIVRGNMVMMLIPADEVPALTPGVRVTAFCHPGDFGVGGTFGLDYDPGLGEPLLPTFNMLP